MFETNDDVVRHADGSIDCAPYSERARAARGASQRRALAACGALARRVAAAALRIAMRVDGPALRAGWRR